MSLQLSDLIVPEGLQIKPTMTTCTIEGSIDEEDLRQLMLGPGDASVDADDPSDLKKIREKHHHVARLIAEGMSQRLVSSISGYTESYISILLNSPAMVELVELYRMKNGAAVEVATEKLKTVGLKALEKLDTKIDNDELSNLELLSAAKLGLDRSGHGPQSKQALVSEHHVIDHARLTELNAEAKRRNAEYIVPQEEVREALQPALPAPSSDSKATTEDSDEADA